MLTDSAAEAVWPCSRCPGALAGLAVGQRCGAGGGWCRSCRRIPGPRSGSAALARWQRSAALFLVCQQAPACPHRSGRDLENSVCLCIESEMTGCRTQPCLLHVPRPICMRNTLLSPSVLACSTFLQEQMCSFSCPLCAPCPIRCPANHCSASKRCFFP